MKKTTLSIAAVVAASLATSQGASIHTGLLNYWALDGTGDDSASDYIESTSTVEDDMTVGGTAGAATIASSGGLFGGAADFERNTGVDGRLAAANSVDLNFEGETITTSLWVDFEDNTSGNWQALLVKGEGSNYRISTNRGGGGQDNANAAFGAGDINSGVNIRVGDWHHILVTAVAGSTVSLYVDGVSTGTQSVSNIVDESSAGNPLNGFGELWIGNNNQEPNRMWDGLIDDVAQWDRALTAAEVTQIYNAGSAGISLGQIPEPTAGLLLALSSLTLTLRRRR